MTRPRSRTLRVLPLAAVGALGLQAQEPDTQTNPRSGQAMPAMIVEASRYKEDKAVPEVDMTIDRRGLPLEVRLRFGSFGDANWGDFKSVFTPSRVMQKEVNSTPAVALLITKDLKNAPALSIDRALAQALPEFSLSSRNDSLSSPGFLQGAALRGIGALGGGTLVLLDGAPLSDPWGNLPRWSDVPRHGLIRAESVPAGGATSWGEGAGGGVIQLIATPPSGRMRTQFRPMAGRGQSKPGSPSPSRPTGQTKDGSLLQPTSIGQITRSLVGSYEATALIADDGTRRMDVAWEERTETGIAQITGTAFSSDGFAPLSAGQRGAIDGRTWSRGHRLSARWRQPVFRSAELLGTVRITEDLRSEGTPYQQTGATGTFASLALTDAPYGIPTWTGVAYVHAQRSHQRWSWVDPSRTTETPVVDQFAMPSVALGALWGGAWWNGGDARTMAGADVRLVQGELREHREFANGAFQKVRNAGGNQGILGAYVSHNRGLTPRLRASVGARLDAWRDGHAFRRESSRDPAGVRSDERFSHRSGLETSAGAGLVWHATDDVHLRFSGQHGFRRPSLQERFQDLGHHSRLILADPLLRRERIASVDLSTSWNATRRLELGAALFANQRHHALGVRSLPTSADLPPVLAGAPAGYEVWTRTNIDRIEGHGARLSGTWTHSPRLSLEATVLWNNVTLDRLASAPELQGRTPPQVARRVATFAVVWSSRKNLEFRLSVRAFGPQFVDTENTRALEGAAVTDLGLNLRLARRVQLTLTGENVGNARVRTDESSSGLVTFGAPRRLAAAFRIDWP
ncbi:MAG: TonB-dependent receptor [Opitutaceae bacterium]